MYKVMLIVFLFILGCSRGPDGVAGTDNASETTNGFAGVIIDEYGKVVSEVELTLVPAGYNAFKDSVLGEIHVKKSDSSGFFLFSNIQSGEYNLQAFDPVKQQKSLISHIEVRDQPVSDTLLVSLFNTSTIDLNLDGFQAANGDYLYIPGTLEFKVIDSTTVKENILTIESLPTGEYEEIILTRQKEGDINIVKEIKEEKIFLDVSEIFEISIFMAIPGHSKIQLNTSPSGLGITADLSGFPLLLKLDSNNFDFSEEPLNGEGLRFFGPSGEPLYYEIERWSSFDKYGDVWVKVETLFGDDVFSIDFYWGLKEGNNTKNSEAVFDTSLGYLGVWHFQETTEDLTKEILDVTYYQNHGVPPPDFYGALKPGESPLGRGIDFSDPGSFIDISSISLELHIGNPLNISYWFKTDDHGRVFLTSGGSSTKDSELFRTGMSKDGNFELQVNRNWEKDDSDWFDNIWHYVNVTFDTDGTRIVYLDGNLITGYNHTMLPDYSIVNNVIVGAEYDGNNLSDDFRGVMDELRFMKKLPNEDWVKATYINQSGIIDWLTLTK